jgi:thioredoxin reductase
MKPTRMIDPAMEVPHTAGEAVVEVAQMEMRPAPRNGRHPLLRYLFGRCHIDMPRRYTSARIENYLGFPTGISGIALMAGAYNQAQKFGVQLAIPDEAISLSAESVPKESRFLLRLANGEQAVARSVVIASGARYRRLALPQMDAIEATSVHYWASPLEAKLCAGQEIALVGAGNSAGQAVVYLASQVAKVWSKSRYEHVELPRRPDRRPCQC